jgi:hypothetical protein
LSRVVVVLVVVVVMVVVAFVVMIGEVVVVGMEAPVLVDVLVEELVEVLVFGLGDVLAVLVTVLVDVLVDVLVEVLVLPHSANVIVWFAMPSKATLESLNSLYKLPFHGVRLFFSPMYLSSISE